MLRALAQYGREEVFTRLSRILGGSEVFLSIGIGILTSVYGPGWSFANVKPSDVSTALLTYAAIAFGFCISGLALVLTLPNQSFVKWLIQERVRSHTSNAYSDLLFVFSWTALFHWILVSLSFTILIAAGSRPDILNWYDGRGWRTFIGIFFGVATYSFVQFLLTVITLSQVGRLYITKIERELDDTRRIK